MRELQMQFIGPSPLEKKENLIRALASALRWYAMCDNKRIGDDDVAVDIADMIEELVEDTA